MAPVARIGEQVNQAITVPYQGSIYPRPLRTVTLEVEGIPVAVVEDRAKMEPMDPDATNAPHDEVLKQGSAHFYVGGFPVVRMADGTSHGGLVMNGCESLIDESPPISMEEMARADALKMLDRSIASLERWDADDRANFAKWFGLGSDTQNGRDVMLDRLRAMKEKVATLPLERGWDDPAYGHVQSWDLGGDLQLARLYQEQCIYLDPGFWLVDRRTRAGTLVHESAHFDEAGGAGDMVYKDVQIYGEANAAKFAEYRPATRMEDQDMAARNADNIEYFVEHAYGSWDPPP